MLAAVTVFDEIIDELLFCIVSSGALPGGAGEVVHKIDEDVFGVLIGKAAKEQKGIGQAKLIGSMAAVSTGLPFFYRFGFLLLFHF